MAKRSLKTRPRSRKPTTLGVLLVDDHAMLLDVMRRQFEADPAFKVMAAVSSVSEACDAVAHHQPDVVLLDIELGEESGLDAIGRMLQQKADLRIVMLSMFDQAICRDRAFELGAEAYVTKGARFEALRALLLGEAVESLDSTYIWRRGSSRKASRLTLTPRERQVVQALSSGKREKEVADELDISVSSVGTYLNRAMLKTGLNTRAELFRYASAFGGVDSNPDCNN
jgi:DNA-binding NarL/FixJ family response regulator